MSQRNFVPTDWVERLRARLEDLVDFEKSIEFMLTDFQRQDEQLLGLSSRTYGDFNENIRGRVDRYHAVIGREPRDDSAYWQGVHSRVNGLVDVLLEHPVLDRATYTFDGELVIGLELSVKRLPRQQVCFMVVGLVDYAVEHTPQVAANAFARLIDEGERQELISYEMVLFRGMHVESTHEISQDLSLIPWEEARQYIPDLAIQSLLGMDNRSDGLPIGVVACPARWGPAIVPGDYDFEGAWPDRPRSFRDDALLFINLLSVTHGLGLQSTGNIYNGVGREIERLVGSSWSSRMGTRGGHANMVVSAAPELLMERLSEAKRLFPRMHEVPDRLRLALSRLASSLSRSGGHAVFDGIVDVAIALEAMYQVGPPEQTYRLATRASYFLEESAESRVATYKAVRDFYKARSAIVHGGTGDEGDVLNGSLEIARRTLTKLVLEGGPSSFADWDELVIAGRLE